MAKIVLVSKHVNATTWQLAQALKAQQHEVVFLTSHKETIDNTNGIEFMAYFRKWSLLEGLKIIPGLFGLNAQILHLVLDEDSLNPAQLVLATYAKSHPQCILTTSLMHIKRGLSRKNPVRYLIEESDIVTCSTIENLAELRGLNIKTRRQGRGILPPALPIENSLESMTIDIDDQENSVKTFIENKKFVVIPFFEKSFDHKSEYFLRLLAISKKYNLVLWGSYSHWSLRQRKQFTQWFSENNSDNNWLVTGDVPQAMSQQLLAQCESLILAGLVLTPIELTEYFMKAIPNHCTLVLDSSQASVHGTLWKHGQNCWILNYNKLHSELVQLLNRNRLKTNEKVIEKLAQEKNWLDHPMNELNRLYNRALEQRP